MREVRHFPTGAWGCAGANGIWQIPLLLTSLRLVLAPLLVVLGFAWPSPAIMGVILVAAFLSDVCDGVIARRLGVAVPGLRRLDSAADTLFYIAVAVVAWHLYPAVIVSRVTPLLALGTLESRTLPVRLIQVPPRGQLPHVVREALRSGAVRRCFSLLARGSDDATLTVAVYCGFCRILAGLLISVAAAGNGGRTCRVCSTRFARRHRAATAAAVALGDTIDTGTQAPGLPRDSYVSRRSG